MTNEQNLFLVTTVAAAGEDGLVGRLYLTADQALTSAAVNEIIQPVFIRDATEPTVTRGNPDWVGRLCLWADNPVMLSAETFRALADEMERLRVNRGANA